MYACQFRKAASSIDVLERHVQERHSDITCVFLQIPERACRLVTNVVLIEECRSEQQLSGAPCKNGVVCVCGVVPPDGVALVHVHVARRDRVYLLKLCVLHVFRFLSTRSVRTRSESLMSFALSLHLLRSVATVLM